MKNKTKNDEISLGSFIANLFKGLLSSFIIPILFFGKIISMRTSIYSTGFLKCGMAGTSGKFFL